MSETISSFLTRIQSRCCKGFAFIEFEELADADAAFDGLQQKVQMRVRFVCILLFCFLSPLFTHGVGCRICLDARFESITRSQTEVTRPHLGATTGRCMLSLFSWKCSVCSSDSPCVIAHRFLCPFVCAVAQPQGVRHTTPPATLSTNAPLCPPPLPLNNHFTKHTPFALLSVCLIPHCMSFF